MLTFQILAMIVTHLYYAGRLRPGRLPVLRLLRGRGPAHARGGPDRGGPGPSALARVSPRAIAMAPENGEGRGAPPTGPLDLRHTLH